VPTWRATVSSYPTLIVSQYSKLLGSSPIVQLDQFAIKLPVGWFLMRSYAFDHCLSPRALLVL
jgi:hypothetical protein